MKRGNITLNVKPKRLFGRTDEMTHKLAKIAATREGIKLEDWIEQAVKEKLSRERDK